jgi:hypothetical protein
VCRACWRDRPALRKAAGGLTFRKRVLRKWRRPTAYPRWLNSWSRRSGPIGASAIDAKGDERPSSAERLAGTPRCLGLWFRNPGRATTKHLSLF